MNKLEQPSFVREKNVLRTINSIRESRQIEWLRRLKKLQKVEENFKQFPLLPIYKPRLVDPAPHWITFFRQKQAFQYVTSHQEDVHVFAYEIDKNLSENKGQRKYCVTSYSQLWHVIKHAAKGCHVSFYEVIPDGATCKLYFDLEYNKQENPGNDGKQMVNTLIQFVCDELRSTFKVNATCKNVLILDASTDSKFSNHLIFNIPDFAFKDNLHQGHFVLGLCCKIRSIIKQQQEHKTKLEGDLDLTDEPITKKPKQENDTSYNIICDLLIKDKNGKECLFIDEGVYTKNRNFRLYKCCKQSKKNPLLLADYNEYKAVTSKCNGHNIEHQIFLDSVISNVRYSAKMRVYTSEGFSRDYTSLFDGESDTAKEDGQTRSKEDVTEGYQSSLYPSLDSFILSKVNRGGINGEIRRWSYYSQGGILVYNIAKNRWCENVGRQHKSNNIIIIVDLKKAIYYQKCLDPECRVVDYRSPDQDIPLNVLPTYDDLDDDELIEAVNKYEASQMALHDDGGIQDFLADDENDDILEAVDCLEKSIEEAI